MFSHDFGEPVWMNMAKRNRLATCRKLPSVRFLYVSSKNVLNASSETPGVWSRASTSGPTETSIAPASPRLSCTRTAASSIASLSLVCAFCSTPTAAPVSIDPYVVAFGHETIFEGSQIEGALSRRLRQTQGAARKDLLGFDALHKALAKKTSRDRGCRARADSRQAL